jgi:TP901 family phage tail tape measure protein
VGYRRRRSATAYADPVADEVGRAGGAFVELEPRLSKGFEDKVGSDLEGPLGKIGAKASALGGTLTKSLTLPIIGGVAAIGGGLLAAGAQIDDALDNIRTSTGATGKTLEGLEGSFRTVAARVPDSFDAVSAAIATLHQRTGATGKGLEELAQKELTLARLTGGDVASTIEGTSKLFAQWNVPTAEQGALLDKLYRASQATGIGIDELTAAASQAAPSLQAMGFTLDQSVALLGKFEKEGVNSGTVLAAMKKGLASFTKEGEAAPAALARLTSEIKAAKTPTEAAQKAMEVFGAKAGPELASLIRAGRLDVGELLKTVSGGSETILGAAKETDDFGQTFARLKNQVLLAVEPLATKLFDALGALAPKLLPVTSFLTKLIDGLVNLSPKWQVVIAGGLAFAALIGPILSVVGAVTTFLAPAIAAATAAIAGGAGVTGALSAALGALISPVLLVVVALAAIAAGAVYAYTHFEGFREVVDTVVSWIVTNVPPLVAQVVDFLTAKFGELLAWVQTVWPAISEAIGHVMRVIQEVVGVVIDVIAAAWRAWGDDLLRIATTMFGYIKGTIENVLAVVRGVIVAVLALINGDWGKAWDAIRGVFAAVWDQVKLVLSTALEVVKSLIGGALSAVGVLWQGAWDKVGGILGGAWDGIKSTVSGGIDAVLGFLGSMPGRIAGAARGMWDGITDAFRSAMNVIIRGWNALEFKIPGFSVGPVHFGGFTLGVPNIPLLADGGLVSARPGGTLALLAEAGHDEVVAPLPDLVDVLLKAGGGGREGSGDSFSVELTVEGNVYGDDHLRELLDEWSDELSSRLAVARRAGGSRG